MEKQGHLLGLLIQDRRQKRGMTLGELAHASGTTATEIKQYEMGEIVPNAETLNRFVRALAVEPAYFCDRDVVYIDDGFEVHPADLLTVTRLSENELETLLLIQWRSLSRSRRNVAAGQIRALFADQQREDFIAQDFCGCPVNG